MGLVRLIHVHRASFVFDRARDRASGKLAHLYIPDRSRHGWWWPRDALICRMWQQLMREAGHPYQFAFFCISSG